MNACPEPRCGQPITDVHGRLPWGWVRVQTTSRDKTPARWYCSNDCAVRALLGPGRLDVAACPTCQARHDRGHLCRSCGHRPPPPTFTYRIPTQTAPAHTPPANNHGHKAADRIQGLGTTPAGIRNWCASQGHPISVTGSLPTWAIDLYEDHLTDPTDQSIPTPRAIRTGDHR